MRPRPSPWHVLALLVLAASPGAAHAQRRVDVASATALTDALAAAAPGDDIVLADGTYELVNRVRAATPGSAAAPIRVRAARPGGALVRFVSDGGYVEGFYVAAPHWSFEDLVIEGACADHERCEHAFHLVGDADFTVVRGNVVRNFNAHLKANGADAGAGRVYPDDVLVEGNELYDESPRMTSNPVTPIDVVGGRRWIVRRNFIHDHQKALGDTVSYAAFLKGHSRDGRFEQNLVVCELLHRGGVRLGLSFGGGGSSPDSICEGGSCTPEHEGGVMRNNVIAACPADVGVYVNACAGCVIAHNTVLGATGIDLRFAATNVTVVGNVTSGRIRDRDGATSTRDANLEGLTDADFAALFADPLALDLALRDGARLVGLAPPRADVPDDFCGNARDDGAPDLGALEYDGDGPCAVLSRWMGGGRLDADAGVPPLDAGASDDAGASPLDAGASDDAGSGADAASPPTPSGPAGCGCAAVGARRSGAGLAAFVVALVGLAASRRRSAAR